MLVKVKKSKFAKMLGEIGQDVLFGDALRLETLRTSVHKRLSKV